MNDMTSVLADVKLRFNIEHPSLEECYLDGYESALAEFDEQSNPFSENSLEHEHWLEGWWAGFYAEAPLYNYKEDTVQKEVIAANEDSFHFISNLVNSTFLANMLKITGALAATAIVGYQVLELVA